MYWSNRNSLNTSLRFNISHLSAGGDLLCDCCTLICCHMCFTEIYADTRVIKNAPNVQIVLTTQWQYLVEDMPLEAAQRRRCFRYKEKRDRFDFDRAPQTVLSGSLSGCAPTGIIQDAFEQKTTNPFDSMLGVEQAWAAISRWAKARKCESNFDHHDMY